MATIFNIGGTRNGTGFGQVTSGTTENKMNNINYDTYLYDDVKLPGKTDQASTTWTSFSSGGAVLYFSKIASHIYVRGTINKAHASSGDTNTLIATIPQEYWPEKGIRWAVRGVYSSTNGCIAKYLLNTDGNLYMTQCFNWAGSGNMNQPNQTVQSEGFSFDYWGTEV